MPELSLEAARDILNTGDAPRILTYTEQRYIFECLKQHPESVDKVGSGMHSIWIGLGTFGTRAFFIQHPDGTRTDFSIYKGFRPSLSTPHTKFRQAAREAASIRIVEDRHIHHEPPWTFEKIVQAVLQEEGLTEDMVLYNMAGLGVTFADRSLRMRFRGFHDAHAKLRLVTAEEHHALHRDLLDTV